jgi:hypothetical protein
MSVAMSNPVAFAQGRGGLGPGFDPRQPGRGARPPAEAFDPVVVEKEPRPPIVNAPFIRADEVLDQVRPEELVLGIEIASEARAYPINMLVGPEREIINDTLGGRAIAATW